MAKRADIPRPKVYEALHLLDEHGFCRSIATDGTTLFRAVAPAEAIPRWIRHRDHERVLHGEQEAVIGEQLVARLPEPVEGTNANDPFGFLEPVFGRTRTSQALSDMIERAEHSIDNMTQPPFLQAKARWNVAEREAIARGVELRALFTTEAAKDRDRWHPLLEAGGAVRVSPSIPMKLIIRDGIEAMIALRDVETGEQGVGNVIIRHPDLVRALRLLFDASWEQAAALTDRDA